MDKIFESTRNTRPILEDSLRFIRSDVPTYVSESERAWLIENGITTIIDLRTEAERTSKVCPLSYDSDFNYICVQIRGGNEIPASPEDVPKSYASMVDDELMKTVENMLESKSGSLYFCNAGKDRTGVVSAVLLEKLGMSREYIVRDYMKSKTALSEMLSAFAKNNPDVDIRVITPSEKYIEQFLDWYTKNK